MGNNRWFENEWFHTVGETESKRLKVAALNLFHPTASPLSRKVVFPYYDTVSQVGGLLEKNKGDVSSRLKLYSKT
jgi:hypothetical protein